MTLDNTKLPEPEAPYYTTDAFTDYAIRFVDEQKDDKPFFLYLGHLQAIPLSVGRRFVNVQFRYPRSMHIIRPEIQEERLVFMTFEDVYKRQGLSSFCSSTKRIA